MSQHIFIDRPPRIQPELPIDKIEIPAPPEKPDYGWARFIQIGLPLITIVGYVLIGSLGGGGRSIWYILPMTFTVIASVAFSVYTYIKEKQRLAEITRAYSARLVELNKDMQMYHTMQRRFYQYNYPDFEEVERITRNAYHVAQLTKPLSRRIETRVWERRTSDADFGAIRLGIGMLPSSVVYTADKIENFEDPQSREALKLQDDSRFVANIPVIISLRQPFEEESPPQGEAAEAGSENQEQSTQAGRTPAAHAVSITGPAEAVYPFSRALLSHFAAFHAPSEARLLVLAQQQSDWAWIENLPHINADTGPTTCFIHKATTNGRPTAATNTSPGDALEPFLEGIRKTLAQRKIQLEDREEKGSTGDPTLPFLLIVVDLLETVYNPQSPLNLNKLEAEPAISFVLENGAQLGAAIIFLAPDRSKAPGGCRAVIEVAHVTPASNTRQQQTDPTVHFRYAEVGVNSFRYVGQADIVPEPARLKEFAALLSNVRIREGVGGGLDRTVPFMRLMGFHSLENLKKVTWQRWQTNTRFDQAAWLQAPIGLMAGNKPRSLIFSAEHAGVHGMVAGSTGSGKSELLISLITALAVTYDPSVLNFVLVDYKGGGAFNDFKDLPHCVDLITNLAGEGVTRMFTAIQSELKRRQALITESGVKDIVAYRQKGLHIKGGQPFPFLFIIIDEFAEMIADRPEYKTQLESITRIGRSLGVSLLLAAQRPSGVTDQMRANIKFRICLRVENPAESREMLRRSEAAFLPGDIPGRGYLQIGNDEIELIQAAFTGDKYDSSLDSSLTPVIWPGRSRIYKAAAVQDAPPMYKVIINALQKLTLDHKLPRQYAPWPEFLPDQLSLASLLISDNPGAKTITDARYLSGINQIMLGQHPDPDLYLNPAINKWLNNENGWLPAQYLDWEHYAARPVVGLVDNPHTAQQLPLVINLPVGHVAIFGASGWGKTTFIRSLLVSLMATHAPNALHVYVLDLGGRHFNTLADFPHVGAIIIPDAEGYRERVEQLLRELDNIVNERKTLLSNSNADDVYQYNQRHPHAPLAVMVVAVDNFLEFQETFGSGKETAPDALNKLIELARQGKPYGLHFIISATQPGILPNPLYNLFTERITLKLADPTEYRAIVGGQVADLPATPGRGYVKLAHLPLSVQIARLFDPPAAGENDDMARIAAQMQHLAAKNSYPLPLRVDALPKTVPFKQILARQINPDNPTLLDDNFWPQLIEYTRQNWQNSLDPTQTDWLTVTPGVISGNRLRPLRLEASADGVHGLIAGGTGAGKSELLMALIVGLALQYDPSILNFVLVDYKGGGAFQPFKELPHCVDTITNLDKAAVKRMFTAITAEMERRQKLNTDTDTKDIIAYRQKGLHLNGGQSYPHLFIIVDEYAEMITNNPEFRDELDSITRLGRSLGINLLLAAQRPIGVTDQMRANIKYRICLRVEQTETSREMLRRADAAFLPTGMPGRGYLQIGNNNIELMQMAFTGDVEDLPLGDLLPVVPPEAVSRELRFFEVVVKLAQHLYADHPQPRTPWPPPLPASLTLASPVNPAYMEPKSQIYLTQRQPNTPLAVNPFVSAWLDQRPGWPGVDWAETAMRAVIGLVDDPYNARQLPLWLDFSRGHAALFGDAGYGKTTVLRTVTASLAATHSPAEFQAHLIGGQNLDALTALPHVGSLILPDERGYEERVQQLLRELNDILDDRKRHFKDAGVDTLYQYNTTVTPTLPAILLAIDNFAEFAETFGGDSKKDAADNLLDVFISLARQGKAHGLHVLITVNRANSISAKLYSLFTERLALRLADAGDYQTIVGGNVVEPNDITGRGYAKIKRRALEFQVAVTGGHFTEQGQLRGEMQAIKDLGEAMHRLGRDLWRGPEPLRIEALPEVSRYRDLLIDELKLAPAPSFVAALQTAMQANWQRTAGDGEHADWLKVPLGITSGNRTKTLRLAADKDGVHGLVAGGTGSGKSELLITMIAGLAINYSPDILNFILVDYKGGGAFSAFERLPHCVGIVTNLNKSAVNRMFTAINAEIRRRQELNTVTKTKDIIDYRKKGLHLTHAPYPHLFIIIDEYAEMISDNDAYRADLESITRVGRAQGVNLLLASQRPKGVSDQMRANIKYRLCLRVEQVDASRELLRRPDAAYLPNGIYGRGYLQVGNDNLELLQVSWTGNEQPDDRPAPVLWPQRRQPEAALIDPPRLFNTVVALSSELYRGQMARKPWPDFLPKAISLQTPLFDAQQQQTFILQPAVTNWLNGDNLACLWPPLNWETEAMRPVVGLLDDPSEARQSPLRLNLARSHLVVLGDTGWGRTALLRTIVVSLAATHSPNDLHIYVLDLGGRAFQNLEKLPHMGAVIYADEDAYEERLQRLLDRLNKLVEERQRLLSSAGVSSLYEYNARQPQQNQPAILVIIDNFAELQENYESLVEGVLMPLARRSISLGLTFVASANVPNNMSSKLYNLFAERVTFKQSNPDRYMDIVGRGAMELDEVPGRGYIRVGRRPLLFQSALPVGLFANGQDSRSEVEEMQLLVANMRQTAGASNFNWRHQPYPIEILPLLAPLAHLLKQAETNLYPVQALIGQNESLEPALIDLRRLGPHFVIIGPSLSGKTTALYNYILSLAQRYPPEQVRMLLLDLGRPFADYGGQRNLAHLPHVLEAVTTVERLEALLPALKAEAVGLAQPEKPRSLFIFIDNFDDFIDEVDQSRRELIDQLAALVGRYGRDGLHFVVTANAAVSSRSSDLWRRIQASNYGLALRTEQALQGPLQLRRTPPAMQGKELPPGRGFLVRAGQPTLLQSALPYDLPGLDAAEADHDQSTAQPVSRALDGWIEQIEGRYLEQRAFWSENALPPTGGAESPVGQVEAISPQSQRAYKALKSYALYELTQTNVQSKEIAQKLLQINPEQLGSLDALRPLLREAWVTLNGGPEVVSKEDIASCTDDIDNLLNGIEGRLKDKLAPEN